MPDRLPGPRPLAAVAVLLLAAFLAGCAQPAAQPAPEPPSRHLVFTAMPEGQRQGGNVVWTLGVRNAGNTTSVAARLDSQVQWSNAQGVPHQSSLPLGTLAPGETRSVQVSMPYQGIGDYFGLAQLDAGAQPVAQVRLWYEECGNALARC